MVKKVVLIVLGVVAGVIGVVLLVGGALILFLTSGDGYLTTGQHDFTTTTYAVVSPTQTVRSGAPNPAGTDLRLRLRATGQNGSAVFLGVAAASAVDQYLRGVAIDEVTRIRFTPFRLDGQLRDGTGTPARPAAQPFWLATASGTGQQVLDWPLRDGDYRLVVMNAAATQGVDVRGDLGVRVPGLRGIGIGLLVGGAVLLLLGLVLLIWGVRVRTRPVPAGGPGWPAPAGYPGYPGEYPGRGPDGGYPPAGNDGYRPAGGVDGGYPTTGSLVPGFPVSDSPRPGSQEPDSARSDSARSDSARSDAPRSESPLPDSRP